VSKISKALNVGIVALALAAPGTAIATLIAPPARADLGQSPCSGPGDFGTPNCQDQPGQGFMGGTTQTIDGSQLPSGMGPDGSARDWGHGLPGSTDPRFVDTSGGDAGFVAYLARGKNVSPGDSQVLVQAGHKICSDLAQGFTYDQEATRVVNSGATRGGAITMVEAAHIFYCPTQ
jgi:hypothetical protein